MAGKLTITDQFVLFWDGWPSQWHCSDFAVNGVRYNCGEQYMMAEKARVFADQETLGRILAAQSPREQKALGRQVRGFQDELWNGVCRGIVYTGNLAKFSQNAGLARRLLATDSRILAEASPVDRIWGIGLSQDDPRAEDMAQWQGSNWLGVALMQVRQTLGQRTGGEEPSLDAELQRQLNGRAMLTCARQQG